MAVRIVLILVSWLCLLSSRAQVNDSFTDGDFTQNPAWTGTDSQFVVNASNQLQTNDAKAGTAWLSTPQALLLNVEWTFWVRFNLSPSTQNNCRFYLSSDSANFDGNGYYVQLGGSTGNTDSLSLYKQAGNQRSRVIAGRASTLTKSSNVVRVRVTRDAAGNWQLLSDTSGGNNFVSEGSGFDNEFTISAFAGIWCKYTSSNGKNFYWDDLLVKTGTDTSRPRLLAVTVTSGNSLELQFSEPMDSLLAKNTANFGVNGGIGTPAIAGIVPGNMQLIGLVFAKNFTPGGQYNLTAIAQKDLAGNTMNTTILPFTNTFGQISKVLINELMADPIPKVGLPDFEFVELHNPGTAAIDLSNWTLSDGSSTATITNGFGTPWLLPDSFIILCSPTNLSQFSPYGSVAVMSSFPSLNNTGDKLTLKDGIGQVVDEITYSDQWYGSSAKAQGGWTLERINPASSCVGKANWTASIDADGGTPGTRNSVHTTKGDTVAPQLLSVWYLDSVTVLFVCSEPLDASCLIPGNVSVTNGAAVAGLVANGERDTITLSLFPGLSQGKKYQFSFVKAADCQGNKDTLSWQIDYLELKEAGHLDVVFSEIYPIPVPTTTLPNVEWVELRNRTANPLKLTGWHLADASVQVAIPTVVLPPNGLIILCHQGFAGLMQPYGAVLGLPSFPSLNNDQDQLYLLNDKGQAVHRVFYKAEWYNSALKKNGGWSLEMVDAANPCGGSNNWRGSTDPRGGTPGQPNSVQAPNPDENSPQLLRVYPHDAFTLQLFFNEETDSVNATTLANYSLSPGALQPLWVHSAGGDLSSYLLGFADSFRVATLYELSATGAADCSGNLMQQQSVKFGLPQVPDTGDIVINELLFNPRPDGVDYVELYNRSTKPIDLGRLKIANTDDHGHLNSVVPLPAYLLLPGNYLCLSADQAIVKSQYTTLNPNAFADVPSFPAYADDEGTTVLLAGGGMELERFAYNEKMHYALLDNREGVSLERVDHSRSILETTNWQSAASGAGYGTPAYQNSQYAGAATGTDALHVSPESFSPDGDGNHDVLSITYTMPQPGFEGNITIYDGNGLPVRQLTGQQLLGLSGSYTWNGLTDAGTLAPPGVYIVWMQYFNLQGTVKHSRKTCVLAVKL